MPAPSLHFWNWNRPVLDHAVEELTRGWSADAGALDLSDSIILCPTAEAVRRLRQRLAEAAASVGSAVMAPHVWHPAMAFMPQNSHNRLAPPLVERMAWSRALMAADLPEHEALFPSPPAEQNLAWAAAVAETLRKLRQDLGAGGLSMQSVAPVMTEMENSERWRSLAALEGAYLQTLADWNLQDAQEAKRQMALHPRLPDGVKKVLVFAVPDAPLLLQTWMEHLPAGMTTSIFVHADEKEKAAFSAWGRPLPSVWGDDSCVSCPVSPGEMHRVAGPEAQAVEAARLLLEQAARGLPVAVGTCDPALASVLEGTLTAEGARVYNPAGRLARQHIICQVLRTGWKTSTSPGWRMWLPFLRMDDVLRALCAGAGEGCKPNKVLEELDDFHARHIPPTVEDAVNLSAGSEKHQALHAVLRVALQRAELWDAPSCREVLRGVLVWLYGGREFDTSRDADRQFSDLFGRALELAGQVDAVRGTQAPSAWLGQVLDALEESQMSDLRGEAELVLHGWLELPWEPAPALVIVGFNDEHVPGATPVDPFLPDKAREKLGLACQATRRSRDACLLRTMAEQRRASGALHVIFGRVSAEHDALRPSRLLLDVPDAELPARVHHLFPREEGEATGKPRPARSVSFQLRPPLLAWKAEKISASDLRLYLACPFRFYLSRVLLMEGVESGQRELSVRDLGNLVHGIMEAFAREPAIAGSVDERAIATWLEETLEREMKARHGRQPLFAVGMQAESMQQRLRALAGVQAAVRREGWSILAAEEKVTPEWGLAISGVPLVGKIDRIEQQESSGRLRIIDYKTSKADPAASHTRKARAHELEDPAEAWKCFTDSSGKDQRWIDLQLPLYIAAVSRKWPDAEQVEAAYLTLPATVSDIKVRPWNDLEEPMLSSAWRCAEEAVTRIKQGVFWPPAENTKFDDYAELFTAGAPDAVVPPAQWKEVAA